MTVKPIRPDEVVSNMENPDEVIGVFNYLITKYWDGEASTFKLSEVVDLICHKMGFTELTDRQKVFKNAWLDVEPIYEDIGWKVEFDKPGFNESAYPATFTFSKE